MTAQVAGQTVDLMSFSSASGDGKWYNRTVSVSPNNFGANVELLVSFVYSGYTSSSWNEAWLMVDNVQLLANGTGTC